MHRQDDFRRLLQRAEGEPAPIQARRDFGRRRRSQEGAQAVRFPFVEERRNFLEQLVQPELAGQRFARIFFARFAFRRPGQQRFAFDLQQARGDDDERGRHVHFPFFHRVQRGQELVGHLRQRDPGDIQLRALD